MGSEMCIRDRLPVCVVLLYVDLLCYVCYVPDVCRSVHTVFCLITTIIVILFKENVNLFRPTSYDMIRHLSENTTKKAAVPHDYCRNNSFFSFNVFYVRRMILFNFTKSITACFPILQIFFMLMEFTPP